MRKCFAQRPQQAVSLRDRRRGVYPLRIAYKGDDAHAPVETVVNVNFGVRPAPALPKVAVLVTPYATPQIAMPFVIFYGTMWIAFAYAFGYLVLWKMRRTIPAIPAANGEPAPLRPAIPDSPAPQPPARSS